MFYKNTDKINNMSKLFYVMDGLKYLDMYLILI